MNHLNEEELIAYRDGEEKGRAEAAAHLGECPECRKELARIEAVFAALDAMPVPDPGADYERRVWQQLEPRLRERRARWWEGLFEGRRLAAVGAMAALMLAAYFIGIRVGRNTPGDAARVAGTEKVRERVLEENRLYRQTALQEGDQAMASTLDELERVLQDIANSPDEVTPAQFESLQKRIEAKGILFKVRVVNQDLREREKNDRPSPTQGNSETKERNKV